MAKEAWGVAFKGKKAMRNNPLPRGHYVMKCTAPKDGKHFGYNKNKKKFWRGLFEIMEGEHVGRFHFQNFYVTDGAVGFLMAFCEDVGRGDVLKQRSGPEDLVGTIFECDIKVTTDGDYENRDMINVEPYAGDLEDADEEDEDDDDLDDDEGDEYEDEDDDDDDDEDDEEEDEEEDEDDEDEEDEEPPPRKKRKAKAAPKKKKKTAPRKSAPARKKKTAKKKKK